MPVKILHVVPSYAPAWRYGGPIRSVHGLCRALCGAGHEVHVYTTDADGPGNLDVPLATPVRMDGVHVWYFPTRLLRRLYWSPRMGDMLRKHAGGFDIIHLHSIYLWPTLAGARAARRARVPYVLSPRGMLMPSLIRAKSRWLKSAWIRIFERSNLAHAAATHFTSHAEAAEAAKLDLDLRRVLVVPNGADDEDIATSDPRSEPVDFTRLAQPFLLFIGRLSREKGLDRLVRCLVHAPACRLVIAGDGQDKGLRAGLESIALDAGVAARITFLGAVHGRDKARLLERAAALVLPSYAESFGNVVLEAMAAGRAVVVTPEVGAAEVVRSSGAGIVVDGEPRSLGEAIDALLRAPERAAQMGARGRAAYESLFTWTAIARQMLAAYEQITREAGST